MVRPSRKRTRGKPFRKGRNSKPSPVSFRLDPAVDFIRVLWLLNHRLQTASKIMMAKIGLSGPQRMVLRIVEGNPGIAAGMLAQALHVHPGTLSSALNRLERRGLLIRVPDPADKRRVLISLTPAGRSVTQPAPRTIEHAIRTALAELSDTHVSHTRSVLQVVARHLEDEMGA